MFEILIHPEVPMIFYVILAVILIVAVILYLRGKK